MVRSIWRYLWFLAFLCLFSLSLVNLLTGEEASVAQKAEAVFAFVISGLGLWVSGGEASCGRGLHKR